MTHTHPFNGPFSGTTQASQYQKGKTNLDFTEERDSEWQWHQLGHMHICTSLLTNNHTSTPPLSFLQAGCPSCHPTNSVKALKAQALKVFVQYGMNVPLIPSLSAPRVARVVFSNTAFCGFLLSYAHAFLYVYMHYVFYFEGGKDICRNCHRLQKDF